MKENLQPQPSLKERLLDFLKKLRERKSQEKPKDIDTKPAKIPPVPKGRASRGPFGTS